MAAMSLEGARLAFEKAKRELEAVEDREHERAAVKSDSSVFAAMIDNITPGPWEIEARNKGGWRVVAHPGGDQRIVIATQIKRAGDAALIKWASEQKVGKSQFQLHKRLDMIGADLQALIEKFREADIDERLVSISHQLTDLGVEWSDGRVRK